MDISMAHDPQPDLECNVPRKNYAEKCINTYKGQNKKVSGRTEPNNSKIKHTPSPASRHMFVLHTLMTKTKAED